MRQFSTLLIGLYLYAPAAFADPPTCNNLNYMPRYCAVVQSYVDASKYSIDLYILNPKDGSTAQTRTIAPNLTEAQALDILKSQVCN